MMKVFGYGTFITRKMYKDKRNVKTAFLPDYIRVFRPQDWFPFVLSINDIPEEIKTKIKSGFWGLTFEVNAEELIQLDRYEGEGTLYNRIRAEIKKLDGSQDTTFLYYPTDETIRNNNLKEYVNVEDLWLEKMKNENPELKKEFPRLFNREFS